MDPGEAINIKEIRVGKPDWLKVKAPLGFDYNGTHSIVIHNKLNTVCEEAACPNIAHCWKKKHVAFMILGSVCTRACAFCNVATGKPNLLDPHEPERLAKAVEELGLSYVVITSVDRDDLPDGGSIQFAQCISKIRERASSTTIEVLTPDFLHKDGALERVVEAMPDVYNHNVETVPALYRKIRPGARYFHSLNLLYKVKQINENIFTKSGIMVGLGETREEILQVMDDLRSANVDFITIGQYLQPTSTHAAVERYITPEEFAYYASIAKIKGFTMVSSSPLTRSSYHAEEDFVRLRKLKEKSINNYAT